MLVVKGKVRRIKKRMIPKISLVAFDYDTFQANPLTWIITAFTKHLTESMVWILIFSGVIFFTYGVSRNAQATVAMIMLVFGIFGTTNYFLQSPEFSIFFEIIAIVGFAGGLIALFIKH